MSPGLVYACDSTSLIDLFQHFPAEFKSLGPHASNGVIKIPEGVFRELRRKTDRLRHYLEQWEQKYQIVIRLSSDTRLLPELARIEQRYGEKISVGGINYPGFWKSPGGRKAADGQVVAVGKSTRLCCSFRRSGRAVGLPARERAMHRVDRIRPAT